MFDVVVEMVENDENQFDLLKKQGKKVLNIAENLVLFFFVPVDPRRINVKKMRSICVEIMKYVCVCQKWIRWLVSIVHRLLNVYIAVEWDRQTDKVNSP